MPENAISQISGVVSLRNKQLKRMYVPVEGTSFNNSFICAGEGKEGACVGDSGGGEEQPNTIERLQPKVNVNNNHT